MGRIKFAHDGFTEPGVSAYVTEQVHGEIMYAFRIKKEENRADHLIHHSENKGFLVFCFERLIITLVSKLHKQPFKKLRHAGSLYSCGLQNGGGEK